jgi:hypothetical protein
MIRHLKTFPLLDGYRGAMRCEAGMLEGLVLRLSAMAVGAGDRRTQLQSVVHDCAWLMHAFACPNRSRPARERVPAVPLSPTRSSSQLDNYPHGTTAIQLLRGSEEVLNVCRYLSLVVTVVMLATPTVALAMDVNFPTGATLDGRLQQEISTQRARDGQKFTMVTPSGSRIKGHLSEVQRANFGRKSHLKLNIDTITFTDETSLPISAEVIGVSQTKQTNYAQAAGTVLGSMIVGNIVGKAIGTNLGGLIGVAGGSLLAANTSQNIILSGDSFIRIRLKAPLVSGDQAR